MKVKAKALDSFSAAEVGMVHAGQVFDVSHVSEQRLAEWDKRGLIGEIDEDDADPAAPAKPRDRGAKKAEG